jgi:hypothetical protein
MPKLPWVTVNQLDPDAEITVMASRLPLRSYRHIPGFMAAALRIRRQLASAEGLGGYALDAQLAKKTFWTLSAWTDSEHLHRFDSADPHHSATQAIRPHMEPSTFVFWTDKANSLPIGWDEARQRIADRAGEGGDSAS